MHFMADECQYFGERVKCQDDLQFPSLIKPACDTPNSCYFMSTDENVITRKKFLEKMLHTVFH